MRREERVTVQGPVKEQQPDGMSHGGGGGGGLAKKKVCKIGLNFPAPLINFIFLPKENSSDVGGSVGRWVGRGWPGPQTTNPLPPAPLPNRSP